jgi:hypothetical protein
MYMINVSYSAIMLLTYVRVKLSFCKVMHGLIFRISCINLQKATFDEYESY